MENLRVFSLSIEEVRASTKALELIKDFYLFYKKWLRANDYYEFELFINQLPAKAQFFGLASGSTWHWLLAWHPLVFDSQIFNYSIGKVCLLIHHRYWPQTKAREEGRGFLLEAISEIVNKKGLKCLWARIPAQDFLSAQVLGKVGFLLYDSSVEWEIDLACLPDYYFSHLAAKVRPWQKVDLKAILKLASQAFCQREDYADRFALDPFLRNGCSSFYKRWMANSLRGEQADQVLVLEYAGCIEGVITLKKVFRGYPFEDCCGWVVLNAISPILRGKGYYYALLLAGLNWLRAHGAKLARVRTKASQWAVIRTWAKLGARPVGSDLTFHYWVSNL